MYTLLCRDEIHDALREGAELPTLLETKLHEADRKLLSVGKDLVRRFPDVFIDRAPREYWWWHLDKGPKVREEAERAA